MNSSRVRLSVVAACLVAGFAVVLLHLWIVMVHQHDEWARKSQQNRWAFRSVPSQRGCVRDRQGRVLAFDEPTTQLALYYQRFRLQHPVGAAVHGATLLASLQPGREGTRYDFGDGALGPIAAVEHLLSMPAATLRRGALPKAVAAELGTAVTTVLSACTGLSRKKVFGAVRRASDTDGTRAVGDLMIVPREELIAALGKSLAALRRLDVEQRAAKADRLERTGLPDDEKPGLLQKLDELRRASLEGRRFEATGSLVETVRYVLDDHVPFDLAASLRIGSEQHPGLEIGPSVERVHTVAAGTALHALLGSVSDLDRAQPDREWLDRFLDRQMPDEWVDELVPEGIVDSDAELEMLRVAAKGRYERAMLLEERRGTNGVEAAFNDRLMGRLGLRLVERDAQRREQLLWSHLRVQSGEDVVLTIDRDVQQVAEAVVTAAQARVVALYADDRDRVQVEAALAVIDAHTGDVLAYAGAPIVSALPLNVPGVYWSGVGYLGSVVKPFVLVEQLDAMARSRRHLPFASLEPCSGTFRYGSTTIRCGHAHWEAGRDPIEAIAESCNLFFYQCAVGLGDDGMASALKRFGLLAPRSEKDPFAACWQPSVRGIPIAPPSLDEGTLLPRRGVGYGVSASPLSVARAYAAIATGALPTVGLLREARPRVPLEGLGPELDVVREGLRRCVETGTAERVAALRSMSVLGKTGTAEIGPQQQNNAWFAGYLPWTSREGVQLCCCAVVYWVPDNVHGGEAAGQIVGDFLEGLQASADLRARWLAPEGGR